VKTIQSFELALGNGVLTATTGFTEGNEGNEGMTKEGTVGGKAMGVTIGSFTGESRGSRDGTGGGIVGGTVIGVLEGNLTEGNDGRARRGTAGGTPTGAGETPALPGSESAAGSQGVSAKADSFQKSLPEIFGRSGSSALPDVVGLYRRQS
jgi:hypothetical protein